jgi:predicted DNA-binding protein YlxM (UPF0122 family)
MGMDPALFAMRARLLTQSQINQLVSDYMGGASQIDLSEVYKISYECVRTILCKELHSPRPHQVRKMDWIADKVSQVRIKPTRSSKTRMSKVIPIVKLLVEYKDKSFAEIAQELGISRERVGQVAELCALANWDVSRGRAVRGKITT